MRRWLSVTLRHRAPLCVRLAAESGKSKPPVTPAVCSGNIHKPESYSSSKLSFPTPHSGQHQSSGTSSHAVPASTPLSGSPISGSYTYPHTLHTYFAMYLTSFPIRSVSYTQLDVYKRQDDAIRPRRVRRAQNRSRIPRVLQILQDHKQRRGRLMLQDVLQSKIAPAHHRENPLW